MKILAIDFGLSQIGIAIGDNVIKIAFARDIIKTEKDIFLKIQNICLEEKIKKIIIGFPKHLNNTKSSQTQKTIEFKNQLEKFLRQNLPENIEIIFFDERYSTKDAKRKIRQTKLKKVEKDNDSIAAASFLQTFLEQN